MKNRSANCNSGREPSSVLSVLVLPFHYFHFFIRGTQRRFYITNMNNINELTTDHTLMTSECLRYFIFASLICDDAYSDDGVQSLTAERR